MNDPSASGPWMGKGMRIGSVVLAFAVFRSEVAFGAGSLCEGVRVHVAPGLPAEWGDAARALADQLPPAPESGCAAITLSLDAAGLAGARLAAMTADGRFAERTVARPAGLVAIALGLVASIPEEPAHEVAPTEPEHVELPPPPTSPLVASPPPAATAPVAGVLLAFSAGFRAAEPVALPMLDFEGRVDALLHSWLVMVSFRYGFSIARPDDYQYEELVVSLGAGRRFAVGKGAVDLSLAPAISAMNEQWNSDLSDPGQTGRWALRLGATARWSTPLGESWRLFLSADADVAPALVARDSSLGAGAPGFPSWTAGLRMGTCGALL